MYYLSLLTFLDKESKFQSSVCIRCHDVLIIMMSMNLNDITILNIYGVDYCCIINGIGKSKAVYLFKNVDLSEKSGIYKR